MKKKFLLVFITTLSLIVSYAQSKKISGKILGPDNIPVAAATITVKGTGKTAISGNDGRFAIVVPANTDPVLVITSVGFEPLEVKPGNRTELELTMNTSANSMQDVVVIGYGTQRRRDLTGSVSSISAKDIEKQPLSRIDQMIEGRVSGVRVMQTNADPGGDVSIRIRGTNSINSGNEPLFVIDGFPGAGDLNSINPNDIASIEILKDASATAIYGTRGANGVILITTKKGRAGSNNINFDVYYGIQSVAKKLSMMNAKEYASYLNDVQQLNNVETPSTARPLPYTQAQIDGMGEGTDWQNALFRQAPQTSYQLSFSGGNTNTRYYLSLNYFDQQGIIINSRFRRGTVRFNLDKDLSTKLKMGFTSQIGRSFNDQALVNTAGGSAGGVLLNALHFNPVVPVFDSSGNYTYQNGPTPYVDPAGNPIAYANKVKDTRSVLRGLINIYGDYELIKDLRLRVTAGTDFSNNGRDFYYPSDIYSASAAGGSALKSLGNSYSWVNENTLTYNKKINANNNLNALVGFSVQEFKNDGFSASANGFFTDALGSNNLSIGSSVLTPTSNASKHSLASYFGRVNYSLMDRYLFTFTMRADGSSVFGPRKKWGYFPSGAFAWRLIDEKFIQNLHFLNDLKLRTSYGVTGNQEIGAYQSLLAYSSNSYITGGTGSSGTTRTIGISGTNIANPDLGWESTASFDIGLDASILNNRINFTADYYYKKTSNLLLQVSVPRTSGFSSVLLNAGKVQNKGVEFAVNTINIKNSNFRWTTGANISFNRNKVLDLNGEFERYLGESSGSLFPGSSGRGNGATSVLRVGEPIGTFYGFQFLGIWQTPEEIAKAGIKSPLVRPGDPRYADLNGDSVINLNDRTIIGSAQPKFIYGLTNNFELGRFSVNIFVQGVQGVNILNLNRYELESGVTTTNKLKTVLNRWTGPGTSNTIPKANSTLRRSTGITSDIVEDGSYLRIKTLTVSYNFPTSHFGSGFKSLDFYVTAENLLTFTRYSGYDPEVNSFGLDNLNLNTDYNAYPSTRLFTVGLRCGF